MVIGTALRPGGTIGIITPASPYTRYSDVLRGIAWWEAQGYSVKLADGALERSDWIAGTPERRAQDLMQMFADPEVGVIQVMRGGYGSAQMIPHVDWEVVAHHPKPFVGFSDITALHAAIARFTGLVTFYGPSLTQMGTTSQLTEQRLLQVLRGETTGLFPADPDEPVARAWGSGRQSGRLAGGCLSDLLYTMGTPWEVDLSGAIFAFEEVGSSPHTIDRGLLQLTQAGKFADLRGVVVGELADCEWNAEGGSPFPRTKVLEEVIEERLGMLGVPVLYKLPFGHGDHLATLPLGVQAIIDADKRTLEFTEAALHAA